MTYPERSLSAGSSSNQCGPYICYYAEASVKGFDFENMPDVENYRCHIINTIIGSCKNPIASRLVNSKDTNKCAFCKQNCKLSNLVSVNIRGRELYVCASVKK